MSGHSEILASFIEGAPPGELSDVIADIKALTISETNSIAVLGPALEKYNEEQYMVTTLPGGSQPVIISSHGYLGGGRYFDVASCSSFAYNHVTQTASAVQSHILEGPLADLVKLTWKALDPYVREHFPNAAHGVYPVDNNSKVAVIIVGNKYSPKNFWNGRWRSLFVVDPSTALLDGSIKVDVHYYEDGNVRLLTEKKATASLFSVSGASIVKEIWTLEKKYQEDLNKGFASLSEGTFKGLRRQLPVTRQKMEWDKVAGYRVGQDIGGGSSRR